MGELMTAKMANGVSKDAHKRIQEDWVKSTGEHIKDCAEAGRYWTNWLECNDIDDETIDIFKVDLGYAIQYSDISPVSPSEKFIKFGWAEAQ